MLRFAAPQWLLLIPVFALLGWAFPRAMLWQPLRAACLGLLVLFLIRPEWRTTASSFDLWVLVDRSVSAADALESSLPEIEGLLENNRPSRDRLVYVDFAGSPVQRGGAAFEASRQETRLRLAVDYALAARNKDRPARLLVISDGFSTEDLGGLEDRLREARAPLDLRLLSQPSGTDSRVVSLTAPPRVQPGEGFLLEVQAASPQDGELPYLVFSDGQKIGEGKVAIQGGRGVSRLAVRSFDPGAHHYEVRLQDPRDARPGNNSAGAWVEVTAGPSVLLVSAYADDSLAGALRGGGLSVQVVTDPSRLTPGSLSGARALVINNVPAHLLPAPFLAATDFFVREQGGGLLMTGGRFSFGSGGYFESPLDPLLPVSMELREDQRKLAVAMAIVLDRSGSMAAGAGPGVTKMNLANEGAARAVELMGPSDQVTVFAVDSEPHQVVQLSKIGPDARLIGQEVRRIESAGGGIFVYVGLEAAWKELKTAPSGQRHIILFADAADAEEPGDYKKLLEEITAQGGTVSVIGLGTPQDSDAGLLIDIAARGKGRIFFNADPSQLPSLFAQETVAVGRSAFLTDPVSVVDAAGWREISPAPPAWLPAVDAYNLSYLKPEAAAAAVTGDDYKAPLVAFWQRGAGRAAAVSFPVAGEYSQKFRDWARAADFERTLVKWLLPSPVPPGASLRLRPRGGDLLIDFLHDETWTPRLAAQPPRLLVAEGASGKAAEVPWEKIAPGQYSARVALPSGDWLRGVIQAGGERWSFGPVSAAIDPEWDANPERLRELRDLSAATGGREIVDLRQVWEAPRQQDYRPLGTWILAVLLAVFLVEIAVTRWRGAA